MLVNFSYLKQQPSHLAQVNKTLLGLWGGQRWLVFCGRKSRKKEICREGGRNGELYKCGEGTLLTFSWAEVNTSMWGNSEARERNIWTKFSGWRQKRHESEGNVREIESVMGTWTTVASLKYGGRDTGDRGCEWPLEAENRPSEGAGSSGLQQHRTACQWPEWAWTCVHPQSLWEGAWPCCHLEFNLIQHKA